MRESNRNPEIWMDAGEGWKPGSRVPFNEVLDERDAERFAERHEAKLVAFGDRVAVMVEPSSLRAMALLGWRRS